MRNKRIKIYGMVLCFLLAGILAAYAAVLPVDQKAVLSGTVVETVAVGQQVDEGGALVRVKTLTGSSTAARATESGTVIEVLVKTGDTIKSGAVVARIEAN